MTKRIALSLVIILALASIGIAVAQAVDCSVTRCVYLPAVSKSTPPTSTPTPGAPSTATPTPVPTPASGIVNGNFELGQSTAGWTISSSNGQKFLIGTGAYFDSPAITPRVDPYSGVYMARLGGFGYEISAIEQTVTLPNVTPLYLILHYQIRAEAGTDCAGYDTGSFFVELNAQKVVNGFALCEYKNTPSWSKGYADVSAFAGQTVPLVLRVEAPYSFWTYLYLDDISFAQTP